MMTQFVPSDTSVAQLPTTSSRIAVPAEVLSMGTTLLDADTTVKACKFLIVSLRPVYVDAVGSVTVQVDAALLLMSQMSVAATVKSAVLVTGAATGCLALKVDQSVLLRYPLADDVATGILSVPAE